MDNGFQFLLTTKIVFGQDKIQTLGDELRTLKGSKAMVVTDKGLIKAGIIPDILAIMKSANVDYHLYDEVTPNPTISSVDSAAAKCREQGCDMLVAIGGGSVIDCTKAIAIMSTNEGSAYDYLDGRGAERCEILGKPLPIIAVPTTAGTGSEASYYAVLTDETTKIKDSISSHQLFPVTAIIDPVLTAKLPAYITACTGMDVLGHALEAYTSTVDNTMTDLLAIEAIRLVLAHLKDAVKTGDMDARGHMAYASMLAGIAMSHCGATIPHALGCPLTGHTGMPHGLAVGLLQIPMLAFNGYTMKDKLERLLHALHVDTEMVQEGAYHMYMIALIKELIDDIGLMDRVDHYIMDNGVIDCMVEDAYIHGCRSINPREVTKEDIRQIYATFLEN